MARSRLVLVEPADDSPAGRRWLAVPGEQHTYRLMHVIADVEDVCRVAPVVAALDGAGTFEHIAVDISPGYRAAAALEEFRLQATAHRLEVTGRSELRRFGALLDGFERLLGDEAPTAAIVYADDDPSLACALTAARRHVPVIQVVPGEPAVASQGHNSALMNRLADLLLTADEPQAERLAREHVPRHRIHVVGDPLMDVLRRYARRAEVIAVCHEHGVEPGKYALVAMSGRVTSPLPLLSSRLPLLVRADPGAISVAEREALRHSLSDTSARYVEPAGVATRLCLERAAGAIVTDSRRIAERAALFGIPCRLVTDGDAGSTGWDLAGLRARRRPFGLGSLKDGGAPGRLADAIIANFARVVPGTA